MALPCLRAILVLLLLPSLAWAVSVELAWDYVQSVDRPATAFFIRRCTVVAPATTCTPSTALPDARLLPAEARSFVDSTIVVGMTYCYHVLAADVAGWSVPSNKVCTKAQLALAVPANLTARVVP